MANLVDERLGNVADYGQAAHHVAIQCAVANGKAASEKVITSNRNKANKVTEFLVLFISNLFFSFIFIEAKSLQNPYVFYTLIKYCPSPSAPISNSPDCM